MTSASSPQGPKLYHCKECGHTTKSSVGMYYHQNQHKGIYPYYCPYCKKGHSATANLKSHLKTQHGVGGQVLHCLHCRVAITEKLVDYVKHVNGCAQAASTVMDASGGEGGVGQ